MLTLINPVRRAEPFDHPDWVFEPFDGFRAAADTVRGWLISRNGARMRRYEEVLDLLRRAAYSMANWWCSTTPGVLCSTNCYFGGVVRLTWPSTC
jgi:hypothetical protein